METYKKTQRSMREESHAGTEGDRVHERRLMDKQPRERVKGLFLVDVVLNNSKELRYPLGRTGLLGRLQPK